MMMLGNFVPVLNMCRKATDRQSINVIWENKGTLIGGTPIMHNGSALILSYPEDGLLYYLCLPEWTPVDSGILFITFLSTLKPLLYCMWTFLHMNMPVEYPIYDQFSPKLSLKVPKTPQFPTKLGQIWLPRGCTKKKFPDVFKSGGNIVSLMVLWHLDKFVIIKFPLKWHNVGFCRSSSSWDIDQNAFSGKSLFSQNCDFFLQKWPKRSKSAKYGRFNWLNGLIW